MQQLRNSSVRSATISLSVKIYSYRETSVSLTCGGTSVSRLSSLELTVVHALRSEDFEFSLDVRIEELNEVKVIWLFLPFDQILDTIFMSDMAFPPDIGQWLDVGVDRS